MDSERPIEILLVDDNEDDVLLMREAFDRARMLNVVRVARDGDEAMEFLSSERRPGLVLLDINMPGRNGFEVLAAIKADPDLRSLPVVMLTTSRSEEDVVRAYADGACSYVSKPVTVDKLQEIADHFAFYWTLVARIPGQNRP